MAKAGRPKKISDISLDLENLKQAVKNVTLTASDAGHVPSIIEFIESEKYLGLPHRQPTPIDLYPFQKVVLKAFYSGSVGNENMTLSEEEVQLCRENNFENDEISDIFEKKDNGKVKSEMVLVWGRRCISEDMTIVDQKSNKKHTLGDLWDSGIRKISSLTYNEENNEMVKIDDCELLFQGNREVYGIETAFGNYLEATENHPLYTQDGWKKVSELNANSDKLAVHVSTSNKKFKRPYRLCKIKKIENIGKKRTFDIQVSHLPHLQNFVCQGFICHNSGKDFIVSILACYEAAKLLESPHGDPYKLYNLGTGAPFTILTVANSSAQAQVLFNEIKDKIINSNYFADKIVPDGILSEQIHLLTPADKIKNTELRARGLPENPGSVIIRCGHSNSDSLAGISCYCLLLDEIGLYKQTAGSSGGESIYRTLAPATSTYVRKEIKKDESGNEVVNNVYDGKIICISSPRGKEGVFYELYRKSPSVPHRVMCKLPTWKVNPNQTQELLRDKFSNMTEEEFMMEFGAEFSGTAGQTFFTRDMVDKCFSGISHIKDHGDAGFSYFCHLDPATSSHNYALCVCHKEMYINPETSKMDFRVVVDHLKYWQPLEGKPILNEEVDNYIVMLSRKFHFELVTFDQWNSQHSIDHLKKHSVPAKMTRFTKRYKNIIYDNLYDTVSSGRLLIPHHDLLYNEMLYLQRRYTPTGYRVFAKRDGLVKTDDIVDALAGSVYSCMNDMNSKLPQGKLVRFNVNSMSDGIVFRGMQGQPVVDISNRSKWTKRF